MLPHGDLLGKTQVQTVPTTHHRKLSFTHEHVRTHVFVHELKLISLAEGKEKTDSLQLNDESSPCPAA